MLLEVSGSRLETFAKTQQFFAEKNSVMLRAILISPKASADAELLARQSHLELDLVLGRYPEMEVLTRSIQVRRPDLVILSTQEMGSFERIALAIEVVAPGLPIVSLGEPGNVELLAKLMHLGVREHLSIPFTPERLEDVVRLTENRLKQHPTPIARRGDIYSFLPASGGVGTTTLATGVSRALANELDVHTLLMDGDLAAGTVQFLLKLSNNTSLIDAIRHSPDLDESLWSDLIGRQGHLDVLHAGGSDYYPALSATDLQPVLALARAQYAVICVDLGTNLCEFTGEFLRESRKVFVVTTPELTAVHLAQSRINRLAELGLMERVVVLLNRQPHPHGALSTDAVSKLLGNPPILAFSVDPKNAERSTLEGEPITKDSELGREILSLAQSLVPNDKGHRVAPPVQHSFLEFLHLPRLLGSERAWQD